MSTIVFLIHQEVAIEYVAHLADSLGVARVILVTSHGLLPDELVAWRSSIRNLEGIYTVADFIDEQTADVIDNIAYETTCDIMAREKWHYSQGYFFMLMSFEEPSVAQKYRAL